MMKIDTKATIQEHSKWVAEKVAEAKEIGIRNGVDGLKVGHVIAMLFKQNEELEDVLLRNGFRRCDVAACNCGSWHQVTGWPERFREIEEVVQPKNGVTLLAAVTELQDELENYQSDAYVLSLLTKLDELESNRDDVVGNLSRSYTREEEKDKRIADLKAQLKMPEDNRWYLEVVTIRKRNCELTEQLEDMTLARDEIQKLHDITIAQLEDYKNNPANGLQWIEHIDQRNELEACLKLVMTWIDNWDVSFIEDDEWIKVDYPRIEAAIGEM